MNLLCLMNVWRKNFFSFLHFDNQEFVLEWSQFNFMI